MSIESINSKIPIANRTSPKSTTANKAADNATQADKINTQIADKIKTALASASTEPAPNTERLAKIKSAIEDGSYKVNAERVAAKILKFEQNMPEGESDA